MRVFVTGGTGLIGSRLVQALHQRRDEVTLLTRRPHAARPALGAFCTLVEGDPIQPGPWTEALDECDAVVNLAGENLFNKRWSDEFKKLMRDSRVVSTDNLVGALARKPQTDAGAPRVLVNASAIGYYGPHGDEELTEDSPPGTDFLARLCVEWEAAARRAGGFGARVAIVRVGVVLSKDATILRKLITPFRLGVGGRTGSGKQWMSWIHHEDIVGILLLALDNAAATGPINGTAPNPVTNRDFAKGLGRAVHRPTFMPAPGFALKVAFGEVADVMLAGQRVLPRRALELGYAFKFPTLDAALADVLK